ncbi:MAG TPA: DUF4375 domain-containing protein [Polyangiaceae bacterium]|nr:DUF4375 domain-containing protein [Polyangiaceae bacterium]
MDEFQRALAAIPDALAEQERLRKRVDVRERCIKVNRDEVTATPYIVWNAFVILLGELPFDRMTEIQRSASLAFHYDSEVQNGGHFQFFVNAAECPERDVPGALDHLSLQAHAALLRDARLRWESHTRRLPANATEFVDEALDDEFGDIDTRYRQLRPTISDALQSLLDRSQEEFVRIEPDR